MEGSASLLEDLTLAMVDQVCDNQFKIFKTNF